MYVGENGLPHRTMFANMLEKKKWVQSNGATIPKVLLRVKLLLDDSVFALGILLAFHSN